MRRFRTIPSGAHLAFCMLCLLQSCARRSDRGFLCRPSGHDHHRLRCGRDLRSLCTHDRSYLGKHIPGGPRVIVQNMPGAGGYTAALHVFSVAPQDGTVIGAIGSSSLPFQPLIDPNSPKLDVPHIHWIGSASTYSVMMLVRSDVPVYSVDDLRKHETVMATIAPGAAEFAHRGRDKRYSRHQDQRHQRSSGYGCGDARDGARRNRRLSDRADRRFETQLFQSARGRKIAPAAAIRSGTVAGISKCALRRNLATTPADRMLLDLAQGPMKVGYTYMLGPGVPPDRIAALRAAFSATLEDPGFLADAQRQILTSHRSAARQCRRSWRKPIKRRRMS